MVSDRRTEEYVQRISVRQRVLNHYEKVICACCFLILFANVGIPSTSFSVFQPYIVEIPGVGHSGGSIVLATRTFTSLLCMLFVARYYRKLNCRKGVLISSLLVTVGFVVYSLANSIFVLCVGAVFAGAGYGLGGMVASTMLIGRWFRSKVGTAAGIAAVGSGVASLVLPPIVVHIIETTSLEFAFGFEALLALGISIIVFVFLRNDPSDMNIEPYHNPEYDEEAAGKKTHARTNRGASPKLMPLIFVAMVCVGAVSVDAASYLGVLFTSEGFSTVQAAWLISINGACLTVAKLCNGMVFDKVGARRGSIIFFAFLIAGLVLCCISANGASQLAILAAVLFGIGLSLGTVGMSVWSIELASAGKQVQTIKNFQIAYAFGGFAFNFLPGFLKDLMGSYVISYEILLGMAVVSAIIIVGVYWHLHAKGNRLA